MKAPASASPRLPEPGLPRGGRIQQPGDTGSGAGGHAGHRQCTPGVRPNPTHSLGSGAQDVALPQHRRQHPPRDGGTPPRSPAALCTPSTTGTPLPGPSHPSRPQTRDFPPPPRGSHSWSCREGASERGNGGRGPGDRVTSAPEGTAGDSRGALWARCHPLSAACTPLPAPHSLHPTAAQPHGRQDMQPRSCQHPGACDGLARVHGWTSGIRGPCPHRASQCPQGHPGVPTGSSRRASRHSAPAGTARRRCPARSSHTPAGRSLQGHNGDRAVT